MRDCSADNADSFSGKRALIVGGSGGIGAAIAQKLAATNLASLTIHGGHAPTRLSSAPNIHTLVQPLTAASFNTLAETPLAAAARNADILCVCYGPFLQKPLASMSAEDWQTIAVLDYALPGFLVSTALPGMQAQHWGRILLFGGTGTETRREFVTNAAYAGAKTAVGTLVQSTAAAYAHAGITCNALLPGFTATEYTGTASAGTSSADALAKKMPCGTLISADSVAQTALFLLQNPDINGALLRIDRGWSPLVPAIC